MNSNKIKLACITVFALAAVNGQAQTTTTDSSSSSQTSSSSTSIGMGGGSSLNNIGTSSSANLHNVGNSSATGGSARAAGGSSNVNVSLSLAQNNGTSSPGSGTGATANDQVGSPGSSAFNTNSQQEVQYSGTQTVKTNPAIQAPGLTTTLSDTCMGSVSFGFSAPGFGATAGSTLVDQACVRRLDAREFRAMGLTDVALALLCQSDANRRAVEATGHLCPGTTKPLAKIDGSPSADATVADDVKYRDPFVRQRMGLAPLDQSAAVHAAAAKQVQPSPVPAPVAKQEAAVVTVPVPSAPLVNAQPAPEPVQAMAVPDAQVKAQELAPSPTKLADPEPAAVAKSDKQADLKTADKAGSHDKAKSADATSSDAPQATPVTPDTNVTPATQPVSTSTTSQNQDWNIYIPVVAKLANVR
jgi:hypothetical protein